MANELREKLALLTAQYFSDYSYEWRQEAGEAILKLMREEAVPAEEKLASVGNSYGAGYDAGWQQCRAEMLRNLGVSE